MAKGNNYYMKIHVDSKELKYFKLAGNGRVVGCGARHPSDWEKTYFDMKSIKLGKEPRLSFQKYSSLIPDDEVVWTSLNYPILRIEKPSRV